MNRFTNIPAFPTADMKVVVRPNFDTLYSSGWLDLTKEPVIVSAPDTGGRYYLLPMLDMWSDVFASPGWRTTGTQAGNFLVMPPGWGPDLRDRFVEEFRLPTGIQRIDAPTPYVWIIGRTKTDGPADYDAVHKIQDGYKITPVSEWGKTPVPLEVKIDPSIDMKTPPKLQVDTMSADKFFAYAAELVKLQPPHITDQPMIVALKAHWFRGRQELRFRQSRSLGEGRAWKRARGRTQADGMEGSDTREGSERVVDEHRHHGGLWQLLSEARNGHADRSRRQPA